MSIPEGRGATGVVMAEPVKSIGVPLNSRPLLLMSFPSTADSAGGRGIDLVQPRDLGLVRSRQNQFRRQIVHPLDTDRILGSGDTILIS